ncbi:COP1-INTERACTING PROTEIN-RELATED [Salix purpurea]|uniref:COP1-INTERACTING PROTEIN-RELATED n=1 Tax=Salix purpurea TaxID=77065 RepID=A0A9Q1AGL6_SALPP|nr:COP1-INTERACTING PROTEIN-RELATED [Salix purpurea]
MHRTSQFLRHYHRTRVANRATKPCDVFINHRGIDTKRTVATLLYDHFYRLNLHPFLDSKNMKPGDKLFDNINGAIRKCKVGVAVFSPRYCESYFCLHELALMMESRKKWTMEKCAMEDIRRFNWALEEAKYTVGLTFDSLKGNWSDVVTSASDNVIKTLIEMEGEKQMQRHKSSPILDV